MRVVIQRVDHAKVGSEGSGEVFGEIGTGLFLLVGFEECDNRDILRKMADKISKLRIIADGKGKMNRSVLDNSLPVLVVSQFTLLADTTAGNRPSFIKAAKPKKAQKLYSDFIKELKTTGVDVRTGKFGEYMKIECLLDGPVTIIY